MPRIDDRVKETTATTGLVPYVLVGPLPRFIAFGAVVPALDGQSVYYAVENSVSDFEVGRGTYSLIGNSISRDEIILSSNSNLAVNWGVGTKTIWSNHPSRVMHEDFADDDHPQYVRHAEVHDVPVNGATTNPISSNWASDHETAGDPHPQYLTPAEGDALFLTPAEGAAAFDALGAAAAAVSAHEAAGDPHPQYLTPAEGDALFLTPAEGAAAFDALGAAAAAVSAHEAAGDPHPGYRLESADHNHQSTGLQGGQLDHGLALTGLGDDDHIQYLLVDGSRAMTGHLTLANSGPATEVRWNEPGGSNYTAFKAQAQAADVTYTFPAADGSSGAFLSTNGSGLLAWVTPTPGITDHGALTGLGDDDHPQYTLADGTRAFTGGIEFSPDNTHDIGAVATFRPRTGYFGTSVFSPVLTGSAAAGLALNVTQGAAVSTGGAVSVTSGLGGATSGVSGSVTIASGETTDGDTGEVTVRSANATGTNRTGGLVTIRAGSSTGTAVGGQVDILAGTGGPSGSGGLARVFGGTGNPGGSAVLRGGNAATGNNDGGVAEVQGGTGIGTGTGGALAIEGGQAGVTGIGGVVNVFGGRGGSVSGTGGAVDISGGGTDDGVSGAVTVRSGDANGTGHASGTVTIASGPTSDGNTGNITIQTADATGTNRAAGTISILAGISTGTAAGGDLQFNAGNGSGTGPGGNAILLAGAGGVGTGAGGLVNIASGGGGNTSGASGPVTVQSGGTNDGNTGAVEIKSGNASGTNRSSGAITINTGAKTGTGVAGDILLKTDNITRVTISGATGDVSFASAATRLVAGATSIALRNNANSADNVLVLDSGDTAIRGKVGVDGQAVSASTSLATPAATTAKSSARVPHGAAPTAPVDGDVWTTTVGLFVRINGVTVGPLADRALFTSSDQTITAAGSLTIAHGLGIVPDFVQTYLINQTAEHGYSIGDIVAVGDYGGTVDRGVSLVLDATNLNVRFSSNAAVFNVLNKTTGSSAGITPANWKVRFRAEKGG